MASSATDQGSDQKLTPEMVDLAVAELRYQAGFYLEVVQAMMDGVNLAAEQVQDKRLEFLEVGPSTDSDAIIITFVLTLVLEGTVGPAIAAVMTRYALQPIMRGVANAITAMQKRSSLKQLLLFRQDAAKKASGAIFSKGLSSPERVDLIVQAQELQKAADALKRDLRGQSGSAKSLLASLNVITRFTEGNLVAGTKAGIAASNLPGSSKPLGTEDSPGVAVTAAAMADASRLRLTVVATREALEAEIRRPDAKLDDVTKILEDYRIDGQVELGQIRDSNQLATEAMIWARLLINAQTQSFVEYHDRGQAIPGERGTPLPVGFPPSVDQKLSSYLTTRFQKEVERWALENDKRVPSEIKLAQTPPRTTGWWENKLQPNERVDLIVQYLSAVSKATPEFKLKE